MTLNFATFQIVNPCDVVFVLKFKAVSHQDKVDFVVILHFYSVNPINPGKERAGVGAEMLVQVVKQRLNKFHLSSSHSFYDKASVMGEKKERTTCTWGLSWSEDLVSV